MKDMETVLDHLITRTPYLSAGRPARLEGGAHDPLDESKPIIERIQKLFPIETVPFG